MNPNHLDVIWKVQDSKQQFFKQVWRMWIVEAHLSCLNCSSSARQGYLQLLKHKETQRAQLSAVLDAFIKREEIKNGHSHVYNHKHNWLTSIITAPLHSLLWEQDWGSVQPANLAAKMRLQVHKDLARSVRRRYVISPVGKTLRAWPPPFLQASRLHDMRLDKDGGPLNT